MVWGVWPYKSPNIDNTDKMIEKSVECYPYRNSKAGDVVVITAGVPVGISGSTNLIQVNVIGDILAKGTGIGNRSAHGRVCVINNVMDARTRFQEGDIIVTKATDNALLPFIKSCCYYYRGGRNNLSCCNSRAFPRDTYCCRCSGDYRDTPRRAICNHRSG